MVTHEHEKMFIPKTKIRIMVHLVINYLMSMCRRSLPLHQDGAFFVCNPVV